MDSKNIALAWRDWLLHERHISLEVANQVGLKYSDRELIIPIKDKDGKHIFNKYRRSPFLKEDGPKYRYDKGASVALYGLDVLKPGPVYVTEGENDALALRTLGYNTVTSTGGALSFQASWVPIFNDREVTIIFDGDKAGVYGAMKTASFIPHAKIAWINTEYGKDITDVIHAGFADQLMEILQKAKQYPIPDPAERESQTGYRELAKVLNDEYKQALQTRGMPIVCIKHALEWTAERIAETRKQENFSRSRHFNSDRKDITSAKRVPIESIIKVNGYGFAKCVYHEEGTPSMKVYRKDNRAYSYCCGKASDAIDVYCAVHGCTFKEAIEKMVV